MTKVELLVHSIKKRGLINTLCYVYHELAFDRIYKTDTKLEMDDYDANSQPYDDFSSPHQGASPWVFSFCIKELSKLGLDINRASFLDIGSGKGRVMILAAIAGFRHVIGVDLDPHLCEVARRNLELNKDRFNSSSLMVHSVDAASFTPPKGLNVAFMYNPFGTVLMRQVIKNLKASRQGENRGAPNEPLYVVYLNPVYAKVFDEFKLAPVREVLKEALIYIIE